MSLPLNAKGMWWLPVAGEANGTLSKLPGGSGTGPRARGGRDGGGDDEETAALLRLAAEQRMNTDVRRCGEGVQARVKLDPCRI